MNPSSAGMWNDPPPPGIDEEFPKIMSTESFVSNVKTEHEKSERSHHRKRSRSKSKGRSRSKDRRRRRHRSRSRRRHRRSRSHSKGTHRRRYSSSRSRSRSSSPRENKAKHKYSRDRRRRQYSRSRSRSGSRSYNRHGRSKKHSRDRECYSNPYPPDNDIDDDADDEPAKELPFKNDGSFLEMFKKMQEEQQAEASKSSETSEPKKPLPVFGKRRGGRVLKTGLVQKSKALQQDDASEVQDPWSIYLKEVKRYKEACCDDDSKTRPLVK